MTVCPLVSASVSDLVKIVCFWGMEVVQSFLFVCTYLRVGNVGLGAVRVGISGAVRLCVCSGIGSSMCACVEGADAYRNRIEGAEE